MEEYSKTLSSMIFNFEFSIILTNLSFTHPEKTFSFIVETLAGIEIASSVELANEQLFNTLIVEPY